MNPTRGQEILLREPGWIFQVAMKVVRQTGPEDGPPASQMLQNDAASYVAPGGQPGGRVTTRRGG
jgi:hypothetical protein